MASEESQMRINALSNMDFAGSGRPLSEDSLIQLCSSVQFRIPRDRDSRRGRAGVTVVTEATGANGDGGACEHSDRSPASPRDHCRAIALAIGHNLRTTETGTRNSYRGLSRIERLRNIKAL